MIDLRSGFDWQAAGCLRWRANHCNMERFQSVIPEKIMRKS